MVLVQFPRQGARRRAVPSGDGDVPAGDGGARCVNNRAYVAESDPSEVCTMSEWDSHDAMMAATDRFGDDFNRDAGTEGLEWETRIWHEL